MVLFNKIINNILKMKQKSFTLIELLVVIVIIGILAGVIIVSVNSSINKANFAKAQAFSSTVQNELLSDLISEWTFDEDSGTTVKDTWGNNDGIVYGATYQNKASGKCVYGGCYSFDGVDNYINLGNKAEYDLANTSHTISFWINANGKTATDQHVLNRFTGGTPGAGYIFFILNGYISFEGRATINPIGISYNFSNSFGSWHLILLSVDNVSKKGTLYVDGKIVSQDDYSGDLINHNTDLKIGQRLKGSMDDVRIYDSAISTSQIKQQYVAGLDSLLNKKIISKEDYNERINQLAQE